MNNMQILEYMTIAEFKRKMIMDRYELGAATKEDTIKKTGNTGQYGTRRTHHHVKGFWYFTRLR